MCGEGLCFPPGIITGFPLLFAVCLWVCWCVCVCVYVLLCLSAVSHSLCSSRIFSVCLRCGSPLCCVCLLCVVYLLCLFVSAVCVSVVCVSLLHVLRVCPCCVLYVSTHCCLSLSPIPFVCLLFFFSVVSLRSISLMCDSALCVFVCLFVCVRVRE